eukprot:31197-Pelagococcus_subviridis.AAC.18
MMCEKVGEACICRLSRVLEKNGTELRSLCLADNKCVSIVLGVCLTRRRLTRISPTPLPPTHPLPKFDAAPEQRVRSEASARSGPERERVHVDPGGRRETQQLEGVGRDREPDRGRAEGRREELLRRDGDSMGRRGVEDGVATREPRATIGTIAR